MISAWFVLIVCICSVYGQPKDCDRYIGRKMEWTNVNNTGTAPILRAGWLVLTADEGVDVFNYMGSITIKGAYTLTEADNNEECYLQMEFPGGFRECVTFSPSLDRRSFVGCYTSNGICIPYCAAIATDHWMAAIAVD